MLEEAFVNKERNKMDNLSKIANAGSLHRRIVRPAIISTAAASMVVGGAFGPAIAVAAPPAVSTMTVPAQVATKNFPTYFSTVASVVRPNQSHTVNLLTDLEYNYTPPQGWDLSTLEFFEYNMGEITPLGRSFTSDNVTVQIDDANNAIVTSTSADNYEPQNITYMMTNGLPTDDPAFEWGMGQLQVNITTLNTVPDTASTPHGVPVTIDILANDALPANFDPRIEFYYEGNYYGGFLEIEGIGFFSQTWNEETDEEGNTITFVPHRDYTGPVPTIQYTAYDKNCIQPDISFAPSARTALPMQATPSPPNECWLPPTDINVTVEAVAPSDDTGTVYRNTRTFIDVLDNDVIPEEWESLQVRFINPDAAPGDEDYFVPYFEAPDGGRYDVLPDNSVRYAPGPDVVGPGAPAQYVVTGICQWEEAFSQPLSHPSFAPTADVMLPMQTDPEPTPIFCSSQPATIQPQIETVGAVDDAVSTYVDTPVSINVLGNDPVPEGWDEESDLSIAFRDPETGDLYDAWDAIDEDGVIQGRYTITSDNTVLFTPALGFIGSAVPAPYVFGANCAPERSSILQFAPGTGMLPTQTFVGDFPECVSDPANVSVVIVAEPAAIPDAGTTPYGEPVTVDVLANDTPTEGAEWDRTTLTLIDPDGNPTDSLTVNGGTYTVVDGQVVFTPADGFSGNAPAVPYRVTDTEGATVDSYVQVTVMPQNLPPVANDDIGTGDFNTPVIVPVLDNDTPGDSPIDPDTLVLIDPETDEPSTEVIVPGEGTWTVEDGEIVFTPEPGFEGPTTPIVYEVSDEDGDTSQATVEVIIADEVFGESFATPDVATTEFNTPITVDVIANDTAPEGVEFDRDTLVLVDPNGNEVTELPVAGGVYTVVDGQVLFTPEDGFSGNAPAVPYRVLDSEGREVDSFVQVTVLPEVNAAPPVAVDDTGSGEYGQTVTVPVLDNDAPGDSPIIPESLTLIDEEGNPVAEIVVPGQGTWTVVDNQVVFTPEDDFEGTTTPVTYQIEDEEGDIGTATVTVTITPEVFDASQALPDRATTPFNTPVDVNVLANDLAPEGVNFDSSTLALIDDNGNPVMQLEVEGGTYTVIDGQVTFTPADGFSGIAQAVPYRVLDTEGRIVSSLVQVTVLPEVNAAPPIAQDDTGTGEYGQPITVPVLDNDTPGDTPIVPESLTLIDGEGNPVNEIVVPGEGVWTIVDGQVVFTPEDGFTGETTPVTYQIEDEDGDTATAIVTVTIDEPVIVDMPEATPDTATTEFNTPVTVDVLANDTPVEGIPFDASTLTLLDADGNSVTEIVLEEGTYTVVDGQIVFTPADGFFGEAPVVDYAVTDEAGNTVSSTVQVTVTEAPAPVPPVVVDDAVDTEHNTPVTIPVLENDTPGDTPLVPGTVVLIDPETGEPVTEVVVPGEGTWTVEEDGSVTFTPEEGFEGPTTPITYVVEDEDGDSDNGTIVVNVGDAPAAPGEAAPDTATTPFETPVTVDVLANDTPSEDATWDVDTLTLLDENGEPVSELVVEGGTYAVVDGQIVFTPEAGFSGEAPAVTYEVTDTEGNSVTSTVQVTVDPEAIVEMPEAINDTALTPFETPVTVDVLANDNPLDGVPFDPTTLTLLDEDGNPVDTLVVEGGTYTVVDGQIVFTPEDGFSGEAPAVTYQVTDEAGNTVEATVQVTVSEADIVELPDATDDTVTTPFEESITIDVLENDAPVDGAPFDPSTLVLVDSDGDEVTELVLPEGTFTVVDGKVVFTPADGFSGQVPNVTYRITDTDGNTVEAVIRVMVDEEIVDEPKPEEPKPDDPENPGVVTGGNPTIDPGTGGLLAGLAALLASAGLWIRRRGFGTN